MQKGDCVVIVEVVNPDKVQLEGKTGLYLGEIQSGMRITTAVAVGEEFVFGYECTFVPEVEALNTTLDDLKAKLRIQQADIDRRIRQHDPALLAIAMIAALCRKELQVEAVEQLRSVVDPNIVQLLTCHECSRGTECGVTEFLASLSKHAN